MSKSQTRWLFFLGWVSLCGFGHAAEQSAETEVLGKHCGLLCLATSAGALGTPLHFSELSAALPEHPEGSSMAELQAAANALGLAADTRRISGSLPQFEPRTGCLIMRVVSPDREQHFVAVVSSRASAVGIVDYPNGLYFVEESTLRSKHGWDGNALLLARTPRELAALTDPSRTRAVVWGLVSTACLVAIGWIALRQWRAKHA